MKEDYENAVMAYIYAFEEKHDIPFDRWVDFIGGVADFNEYYIPFDDIRRDIDLNAKQDAYFEYYDLATRYKKPPMSYESFLLHT